MPYALWQDIQKGIRELVYKVHCTFKFEFLQEWFMCAILQDPGRLHWSVQIIILSQMSESNLHLDLFHKKVEQISK